MTLLVTIMSLFCFATSQPAQFDYAYCEEYPLNKPGVEISGHAVLSSSIATFTIGDEMRLQATFTNSGNGGLVYNPFFDRLRLSPAALAVYDEHHRYLGDVLDRTSGSFAGTGSYAWAYMPTGSIAGGILSLPAGRLPTVGGQTLAPGTYYFQLIYFNAFIGLDIATRTYHPADNNELMHHFDRAELFRSNALRIQLTKK